MTVVNPKSISGINSITMASGGDDLLPIHSNNTTERVRVNNSGDVIVGSGVTLSPDGDIFATGITTSSENLKVGTGVTISPDGDAFFTGVCTATSFVGSGANLTGISGVSVANQGDNRVITNTGTTDALNAEANLTFDGTTLKAETGNPFLELSGTTSNGGNTGIHINANANHWVLESDNYTSQNLFSIKDGTPDSSTARLVIDSSGNTTISSGNLVIGTSGKGSDFSATANAGNSASTANELFDDYEEGTWVPTSRDGTLSYNYANYTKIGRMVHVTAYLDTFSDNSTNDQVTIQGLPFSQSVGDVAVGSVMYGNVSDGNKTVVYLHNSRNGFTFYGGETGGYDNVRYNELSGSSSFYMQATYFAS